MRDYSIFDKFCLKVDEILRVLSNNAPASGAAYPAANVNENELTDSERKHSAALMRVNHAGEIAAQALYSGQKAASKNQIIQSQMQNAALEEGDHLKWCQTRIHELNSHVSYLNPLWYAGSFCIGLAAGVAGDQWSLGFVAETENQVIKHLQSHLSSLSPLDLRSASIIKQMEKDESKHQSDAMLAGARPLPGAIKRAMGMTSKIMVKTAYWL